MSELKTLSDDQLIELLRQQNMQSMEHTRAEAPSRFREYDPTEGMSTVGKFTAGMGRGLYNVGRHAGNLVGAVSDQDLKDAAEIDAPLLNTGAGRVGSAVGETLPFVPATLGANMALNTLGRAGTVLANNPILNGTVMGAGQGYVMADPGHKGVGATIGAVTGGAIPTVAAIGNKLVNGISRTPEAEQLLSAGIRLTPGQMNPEGVMNKMEENLRGWPAVGNIIENARNRAQSDFQRKVIEEAAAPGSTLGTATDANELFQQAQDSYKPLYDAAKGFPMRREIMRINGSMPLDKALIDAVNMKGVGATRELREQAQDFVEGQLQAITDKARAGGGLTSDHLIELRSAINEEIRGAGFDNSGRKYAQLLRNARDQVTQALESQITPDASAALKTANDAYPKLAVIRDAIKRGGDQPNGFTPAQLSQAVRSATENNEYARGNGLLRDWSSSGRDIFTQRNPHTGSALATGAALTAAAAHSPYVTIPAAATALGLVGTDIGRNLVSGQTIGQQAAQRLIAALSGSLDDSSREFLGTTARTLLNRGFANSEHGQKALRDQEALVEALKNRGSP